MEEFIRKLKAYLNGDIELHNEEERLIEKLKSINFNVPDIGKDNRFSHYLPGSENHDVSELDTGLIRNNDGSYGEVVFIPETKKAKINLKSVRENEGQNFKDSMNGRANYDDDTMSNLAFVLGHELGHHVQYKTSSDERRKTLDNINSAIGGNQYDLREIMKLTRPSKNENKPAGHQREADVIGQSLIHLMNNTNSEDGYINAYKKYIEKGI